MPPGYQGMVTIKVFVFAIITIGLMCYIAGVLTAHLFEKPDKKDRY